ncbi:MAG: hypothetical protein GTO08_04090 [Deltaproteobacteria bacterium]|nr:hypothetical protein [Deltaproteobacteria bacterium]
MKRRWLTIIAWVALAVCMCTLYPSPSPAGDVEDSIKEAERLYKKGDYNETIKELTFAIQLVRKKKSERLKDIFPPPLPGWEGKEAEITVSSQAFLGGGIQASREYTRKNEKVTVEILMDNPFLQGILSVVDNALFLEPESEPIRVKGNRAQMVYDEAMKEGELKLVYRKKILVSVRGYRIESADVLREYAGKIKFDSLEEIVDK